MPINVSIRRRFFIMKCVVNSIDNNFTATRVFTKTIAVDLENTFELDSNPWNSSLIESDIFLEKLDDCGRIYMFISPNPVSV